MEGYITRYKQLLFAHSARTDSNTTKDLDAAHPKAVDSTLAECRNEALQVGFNPIQCEDALRGVLQAQYDAAKMILAQQEEKAHALLADFKSRMQALQVVQPANMQAGPTPVVLARLKVEKRLAFLRGLPKHVRDMQVAYNTAMGGCSKAIFLEFLLSGLPQQVRDCCGQLRSDLEQQMTIANHSRNQENEAFRQQIKEECYKELRRMQDEASLRDGAGTSKGSVDLAASKPHMKGMEGSQHKPCNDGSSNTARQLLDGGTAVNGPDGSLLKHPPARARAKKDCMVCMEAIPIGSIIYAQKGCKLVMCQDCTTEMCRTRTRSSGSDGNSNGELMCKECIPSHSIAPSTIARVVPSTVFQGLQARLSREPVHGSWRAFMARDCPDCQNTAAVAAGLPFFMCTSVRCSSKHNLFCIFCNGPWTSGHKCAAPINIKTVEDMLHQEATVRNDDHLENVLVSPCPRCPVRIYTKDPNACYHMTCANCDLQYCGICQYIKSSAGWWGAHHHCVDSSDNFLRSEARRRAVLRAYQEALAQC